MKKPPIKYPTARQYWEEINALDEIVTEDWLTNRESKLKNFKPKTTGTSDEAFFGGRITSIKAGPIHLSKLLNPSSWTCIDED